MILMTTKTTHSQIVTVLLLARKMRNPGAIQRAKIPKNPPMTRRRTTTRRKILGGASSSSLRRSQSQRVMRRKRRAKPARTRTIQRTRNLDRIIPKARGHSLVPVTQIVMLAVAVTLMMLVSKSSKLKVENQRLHDGAAVVTVVQRRSVKQGRKETEVVAALVAAAGTKITEGNIGIKVRMNAGVINMKVQSDAETEIGTDGMRIDMLEEIEAGMSHLDAVAEAEKDIKVAGREVLLEEGTTVAAEVGIGIRTETEEIEVVKERDRGGIGVEAVRGVVVIAEAEVGTETMTEAGGIEVRAGLAEMIQVLVVPRVIPGRVRRRTRGTTAGRMEKARERMVRLSPRGIKKKLLLTQGLATWPVCRDAVFL